VPDLRASLESTQDFVGEDGLLRILRWAEDREIDDATGRHRLGVDLGPRPVPMAHSTSTGEDLVSNGLLGADVIRLGPGEGFVPHTHPGDHLLIVIGGYGTITYDGRIYPTKAGEIYMVEGGVPHAVGAVTEHVILAVGAPHRPVGSADRMTPVEYDAIEAEIGKLECLICGVSVAAPERLHAAGCRHCPCPDCLQVPDR
jgi:quercetin dioxygenase-like cupin family protein